MQTYTLKIIGLIKFVRRIRTKACTLGHSSVERPEERGAAISTVRPPRDAGSVARGRVWRRRGRWGEGLHHTMLQCHMGRP